MGKNRIISTLQTLAAAWERPFYVMVITLMGTATVNVNSHTIHSTFNFDLFYKLQRAQPTTISIKAFVALHLFIIEKLSTYTQKLLGSIGARLKQLINTP